MDDRFYAHPKHLRAGLAANGLFVRGLAYSAGYETDGFLPDEWVRGQLGTTEERKLPARLVECRLWQQIEGGYVIHDYLTYNMSKAKWATLRVQKSEAGKKGAHGRWHGTSHGECLTEPEPEPEPENGSRPLPPQPGESVGE